MKTYSITQVKNKICASLLTVLLVACNTGDLEFENLTIAPIEGTHIFPIGTAKYTMRDLIEDIEDGELTLEEDSSSFLTLVYRDTLQYDARDEFIEVDDLRVDSVLTIDPIPLTVEETTIALSYEFSFEYKAEEEEQINELQYESGTLAINVRSTLGNPTRYTFTIEDTKNLATDQPVSLSGSLTEDEEEEQMTQELNGYATVLSTVDSDINQFTMTLDLEFDLDAGEALANQRMFEFEVAYLDQAFSLVYGLFGQDTIAVGTQSLDIAFFEDMGEEGIYFSNPTISIDFRNTFGVPIGVDFSGLSGDDGEGGNQVNLSGEIVDDPTLAVIPSPEVRPTAGAEASTTIEINDNNSNLVDMLATSPSRLNFTVDGISNRNSTTVENFVRPDDRIDGYAEIVIPMEIRLENLEHSGTLSLGDGLDTDNVDSVYMRLVTVNELPFSGLLSLEIQDADSNALYTVSDNVVLASPFINVDGLVTDPSGNTVDIPIDPTGVEALATGSHLLLTVSLNTPQTLNSRDIFVKILADYELEIKLGVGARVYIEP